MNHTIIVMIVSCQGEMESNTTWFSEAKRGVGANSYLIIEHDMMGGKSVPLLKTIFHSYYSSWRISSKFKKILIQL